MEFDAESVSQKSVEVEKPLPQIKGKVKMNKEADELATPLKTSRIPALLNPCRDFPDTISLLQTESEIAWTIR